MSDMDRYSEGWKTQVTVSKTGKRLRVGNTFYPVEVVMLAMASGVSPMAIMIRANEIRRALGL